MISAGLFEDTVPCCHPAQHDIPQQSETSFPLAPRLDPPFQTRLQHTLDIKWPGGLESHQNNSPQILTRYRPMYQYSCSYKYQTKSPAKKNVTSSLSSSSSTSSASMLKDIAADTWPPGRQF
ncbi:hypothetical protein N658DRAFT_239525 [Parathielavia hyrcaniae]|uniref:Uncharacterized protein n=1 Tax=Parathielavia hyrcaniae TaxID=113614 RepID=A0AAN6T4S4_9PEZI|nr:hypothetical protein N658DRAFT_239525 [Parathielavia hyrcaniae]